MLRSLEGDTGSVQGSSGYSGTASLQVSWEDRSFPELRFVFVPLKIRLVLPLSMWMAKNFLSSVCPLLIPRAVNSSHISSNWRTSWGDNRVALFYSQGLNFQNLQGLCSFSQLGLSCQTGFSDLIPALWPSDQACLWTDWGVEHPSCFRSIRSVVIWSRFALSYCRHRLKFCRMVVGWGGNGCRCKQMGPWCPVGSNGAVRSWVRGRSSSVSSPVASPVSSRKRSRFPVFILFLKGAPALRGAVFCAGKALRWCIRCTTETFSAAKQWRAFSNIA